LRCVDFCGVLIFVKYDVCVVGYPDREDKEIFQAAAGWEDGEGWRAAAMK
jgi:hypothetical protein